MDASDFYDTAVLALKALDHSIPMQNSSMAEHSEATLALRDFIRAADEERERNNTRSNYRAHIKEGEMT